MEHIQFMDNPSDSIRAFETSIYNFRMQSSDRFPALFQREKEVGTLLRDMLPEQLYEALAKDVVECLRVHEQYWWARGLESGVKNETTIEMRNIVFGLPSTPEVDAVRRSIRKLVSFIKKNMTGSEFLVREYQALCLEDCRLVAPYAYLHGFEWGREAMRYAGLESSVIAWNSLYKILSL